MMAFAITIVYFILFFSFLSHPIQFCGITRQPIVFDNFLALFEHMTTKDTNLRILLPLCNLQISGKICLSFFFNDIQNPRNWFTLNAI